MRRTRVSSTEFLERLVPVESLDEEGRALYRALMASRDDGELMSGAARLLDRLCENGVLRRLERTDSNGGVFLKYRNLQTLDVISITVPHRPQETPQLAARDLETASGPPLAEAQADLPAELLQAVAASSRRIDLAGALNHLYDLLRTTVGYDHVALYMSRGLRSSLALSLSEFEEVFRWPEKARMCPAAVAAAAEQTGKVLHVADVSHDQRLARQLGKGGHGSLVLAPLKAEAYVYGTLELWSNRPDAYDARAVTTVEFVAGFAAGLIKRRLELEELVFIDPTSQIHNRRYFEEQLTREIERTKRTGSAVALLIADLDGFKQVNDSLGHAAGDSILRQVGRILAENARQLDIVARYGGEEFAVILPAVTRETARAVAERMRSTIEQHPFTTSAGEHDATRLTISIGGALYPLDAQSRVDLIDKADRVALYEAKGRGKNRVVFWEGKEA
jgi:diguanylate cyclase (GGDEF)-like protein